MYVYVCNVWEDVHVCVVNMSVGMRREGGREEMREKKRRKGKQNNI